MRKSLTVLASALLLVACSDPEAPVVEEEAAAVEGEATGAAFASDNDRVLYALGVALGEGQSLGDVLKSRVSVTEGIYTASALIERAAARGIDMPIAQAVHAVVSGLATVDEAIEALLARPLRPEA